MLELISSWIEEWEWSWSFYLIKWSCIHNLKFQLGCMMILDLSASFGLIQMSFRRILIVLRTYLMLAVILSINGITKSKWASWLIDMYHDFWIITIRIAEFRYHIENYDLFSEKDFVESCVITNAKVGSQLRRTMY